jgi:hypothetical protein
MPTWKPEPAADPLADLRAPDPGGPEAQAIAGLAIVSGLEPGQVADALVTVVAGWSPEQVEAAVPAVVARWHADPTAERRLHPRGSVCACAYLARVAMASLEAPEGETSGDGE